MPRPVQSGLAEEGEIFLSLDIEQFRKELDELERELGSMKSPLQAHLGTWRHRMNVAITELVGARSALAIRFNGLLWPPGSDRIAVSAVLRSNRESADIIRTLRWELDRRTSRPNPFDDTAIDSELWMHVQILVEAGEWDKVALNAAVFVEDKLRDWAQLSTNLTGSVDAFKAALATDKLRLGDRPSEQQGWQQLASGFALALRNRGGHRIEKRPDAKRYALGVLGLASLLLIEIRSVYGDPPTLPQSR